MLCGQETAQVNDLSEPPPRAEQNAVDIEIGDIGLAQPVLPDAQINLRIDAVDGLDVDMNIPTGNSL